MLFQTALITGATSGIGYAMAEQLALQCRHIIIVGRNHQSLENIAKKLSSKVRVTKIKIDLAQRHAAENIHKACIEQQITVDLLVNNAGAGAFGPLHLLDPDRIGNNLQLNIITLTQLCMLFAKDMLKNREGSILNIGSTSAYQPVPYMSAYAAAKTYVLHLSEALALELENTGVSVTCIAPGMTDTPWFEKAGIMNSDKGFFAQKNRIAPEKVAAFAIKMTEKKRRTAIHGKKNRFIAILTKLVPRRLLLQLSKNFVKSELPDTSPN